MRWGSSYSTQGLSTAVVAAGSAADPFTGECSETGQFLPPEGLIICVLLASSCILSIRYFIAQAFRDFIIIYWLVCGISCFPEMPC